MYIHDTCQVYFLLNFMFAI